MIKNQLKRILQFEKNINKMNDLERDTQEYIQWLTEHPLGDGPSFDFGIWMDSMPIHLIPCFHYHLKLTFPHLS